LAKRFSCRNANAFANLAAAYQKCCPRRGLYRPTLEEVEKCFQLVGMLLRARKYGLVEFEGEMLYQKQDDNKNVRLLKTSDEIREIIKYSGDPANCIEIKQTN